MELTGEIAAIRGGLGDPVRLVGEFRRAVLLVPAADGPAGVVVNVADEDGSMFFPPVAGIVPDANAVYLGRDRGEVA
ncbi:hypothetical protein M8Z33_24220 [Streptomyces sp. ZAF1911]|uniref:hypothetical protein n=1 Tax=Streptomyces sp. ZAF1911 TaxID=2944129 RepID=UPI00237BB3B9|nr:hypothetical protein [Streptomyces sp. ZAF1911]MDD9379706.1 hypothetical protein [Streptomyces sp. ZAF1911]